MSNVRIISDTNPLALVSADSINLPTSKSLAASTVNHWLAGSYSATRPDTGPTLVSEVNVSFALYVLGCSSAENCGKSLSLTNTADYKVESKLPGISPLETFPPIL